MVTFRFGIEGKGFRYLPNQFVVLGLQDVQDPRGSDRPFSLSSSPTETDAIAITTKMTGSPFKERLASLEEGEEAMIRGPMGDFVLDPARPAVMLAGGVGITPLRGMIHYAADMDLPIPVVLLYSNKVPEEIAFREDLEDVAGKWGSLKVIHTITQPKESKTSWAGRTGRIDAALVKEGADGLKNPAIYVAGTPAFGERMVRLLNSEVGVPEEDIRVERFRGYEGSS